MDFEKLIFNKPEINHECNVAMLKAKNLEEIDENKDLAYIYSLYQKAAAAHIAYAERRLGAMTIDGEGTKRDFKKGLGYYLMAAEDGDKYSCAMFLGLQDCAETGLTITEDTISSAALGDVQSIILLGAAYIIYGKHYHRVIDLCAPYANQGVIQCIFSIIDALYDMDREEFLKSPLNHQLFHQSSDWINIASRYINNYNIFKEVLVVNSKKRFENIFKIMKFLLVTYGNNKQIVDAVIQSFARFVTETNSYRRESQIHNDIINPVNNLFAEEWITRKVSKLQTKQRGDDIYRSDGILSIHCSGSRYFANILGSTGHVYEVRFDLNGLTLSNPYCNCPAYNKYDGVCKHIAAVLYSVYDRIMPQINYKNTDIPEYSAAVGSKLLGCENGIYVYRFENYALSTYVDKLTENNNFNFVFEQGGRQKTFGKFSRIKFVNKNNSQELSIYSPPDNRSDKIVLHARNIKNKFDAYAESAVEEYVRNLS